MENHDKLKEKIVNVLKKIMDPEIPVSIYDLGLIYDIDIDEFGIVRIEMTLTTPNCPVADTMPRDVAKKVSEIEGIDEVDVDIVWDPEWTKEMMSDEAKLALNIL